jgi:hypothetical protein
MTYIQPCPEGFVEHTYERTYHLDHNPNKVWDILLQQSTFSKTQIWPFRVEFESKEKYMKEGMDNVHHGPFMLFSGVVTSVSPPRYRDLHYYTGSYFGSLRWVRPARLEFDLSEESGSTRLVLRLSAYVKPWIKGLWNNMLGLFWSNFGRWLNRYISKKS